MKTIDVTVGSGNVEVNSSQTPTIELNPGRFNPFLADLILPVTQTGQTRWNIGLSELRRRLYVNGQLQQPGVDFTINLPYLDYVSPVLLEPGDLVSLTI